MVFPGPGEHLICKKCGSKILADLMFSEDGAEEDYWCGECVDYVGVKVVKDG